MSQIETYKFLEDEAELKWFFDQVIKPQELKPHEEFCFAMAARGKKLTPEEKEKFQLGRAEMLNTQIVTAQRDRYFTFEEFKKGIKRFEVNKEAFTTHTGLTYPEKTLVCYLYINPCNVIKVMNAIDLNIANLNQELTHSAINNSMTGIKDSINQVKRMIHKIPRLYPTCPSHKRVLDFDMDLEEGADRDFAIKTIKHFADELFGRGYYIIVETSGGYHIIIPSEELKFNPNKFTQPVLDVLQKDCKEFVLNKNGFIPCPGTLQYGKLVKVINKEDFDD